MLAAGERRSRAALTLAVSILCVSAPRAGAQSATAEKLFADGNQLLKDGKVAEACEAFEASNRIEARAGTLIRLGECREQNHQLAAAWSAFKDALTRVKDAKKRAIATKKVAELEPRLSYMTVTVGDASKVDGLVLTRNGQRFETELWNRELPVDGGTYVLAAKAPGHRDWQATTIVPEASGKVVVEIPRLEETHDARPVPAPVAVTPVAQPAPVRDEPSAWTGRRKVAAVAGGAGVVAVAAGVTFGLLADQLQNRADAVCPSSACKNPMDVTVATADNRDARSRALVANVSFGIAGAALITTGVLWLTGAPERSPGVAIAPVIAPGTATLTIGGAF